MLWKRTATLEQLNQQSQGCMVGNLGIEFTRLSDDELEATMPVDKRTTQPFGLLHGGASVVLAESLGSMAGYLCTTEGQNIVGLEINANHLKAVKSGKVRGCCRAIHVGRSHQVWQIEIFDEQNRLCCTSRLTTAVLSPAK
ncbi:TPA: hotdog fold thioesterase [Yersinia enterocolitica]|uniref:hotdog fold thioesterase n=1 Tax=Yersinia enterocolitica TaxID=630 RepID=UPI0032F55C3D|nr:hotdog fold thioesterase [Yersinia enterocolitica]HDL6889530.1 hotdog fold thioesterase [Yersinia enterocolitica]HDL7335398.1 hotdog fold thioesterase [Yersinia enterocolitica]HDL7356996.1 hotdog fold thioesterase [Yersinia enterocolitica]